MTHAGADGRRIAILSSSYAALGFIGYLAYAAVPLHVGALSVIPILFIAYYVRPNVALATAFASGIALGFLDRPDAAHVLMDIPPAADAAVLALAFCTVVLVTNRLRETSITNELLRGSLIKARQAAESDPLTGIGNRRYFMNQLAEALQDHSDREKAAVLFCDLDGFKRINDGNGHTAGDELLRMAASRLVHTVRGIDTVARIGGDEFAVLARHVSGLTEALHMAANIERAFNDPFQRANEVYRIGITVGIALLPDDARDTESLLRIADARMYAEKQRKNAGRLPS